MNTHKVLFVDPGVPAYTQGQIWRDRRATAAFVVLRTYSRSYPDGNEALRVVGILTDGGGYVDMERDLDARSCYKMFPIPWLVSKDEDGE